MPNSLPPALRPSDTFARRHLGPRQTDLAEMLAVVGVDRLEDLAEATVPASIRAKERLRLDGLPEAPLGEHELLAALREIANENRVHRSYLGQGYHGTIVPGVIARNVLENPGWYTQYTPYQAEISQGRLEALLNFQTMVADLTGLPLANASLLDEATAAAEALGLCRGVAKGARKDAFFAAADCHPQTLGVLRTRADGLGMTLHVGDPGERRLRGARRLRRAAAIPCDGRAHRGSARRDRAGARRGGARLRGGGPAGDDAAHAARRARRRRRDRHDPALRRADGLRRSPRGLLCHPRQTRPAHPGPARRNLEGSRRPPRLSPRDPDPRAAHPPREGDEQHLHRAGPARDPRQHVRGVSRAGGTPAHGHPDPRAHTAPSLRGLVRLGHAPRTRSSSTTSTRMRVRAVGTLGRPRPCTPPRCSRSINLRPLRWRRRTGTLGVSLDETDDARRRARHPGGPSSRSVARSRLEGPAIAPTVDGAGRNGRSRSSGFRAPTRARRIENPKILTPGLPRATTAETRDAALPAQASQAKDLSLTTSMIPLGSCTMKLNATSEMVPVTWPEFATHASLRAGGAGGGLPAMFFERARDVARAEITGFPAVSLQPNAGSQGEYAGLLAIRRSSPLRAATPSATSA